MSTRYIEPNSFSTKNPFPSPCWVSSDAGESPCTGRSDDFPESAATSKGSVTILSQTVEDFLVFAFSAIPEVDCVFGKYEGNVCHAWIVVSDHKEEVLDRVCEKQEIVMDEFEHCHFDFKVIFRGRQNLEDLISGPMSPLWKR